MAKLIICPDLECKVYIDTELYGTANAGEEFVADLDRGAYWVECVSAENSADRTDFDFRTDGSEHTEHRDIALKPIRYKRLIAQYDSVGEFCCGFAKATKNGVVVGFINPNGDLIYDDATPFGDDKLCVCKDGLWGVINSAGEYVIEYQYQKITPINNSYAIFNTQGKFGLLDSNGVIIISPKYDNLYKIRGDLICCTLDGKIGLLNHNGNIILPIKYDELDVQGNYIFCTYSGKKGVLDIYGNIIIPVEYDELDVQGNYIFCTYSGKQGLLDFCGKTLIPAKYDGLCQIITGVFCGELNHKFGLFNAEGCKITPIKYSRIEEYNAGQNIKEIDLAKTFMRVYCEEYIGLVNGYGNEVIPCKYDNFNLRFPRNKGYGNYFFARVSIDGKFGMVDHLGKEIIPCKYTCDDLLDMCLKVKLGIEFTNEYNYQDIGCGVYRISKANKYGYARYDRIKNKMVIQVPCCLDYAGAFVIKVKIKDACVYVAEIKRDSCIYYIDSEFNLYKKKINLRHYIREFGDKYAFSSVCIFAIIMGVIFNLGDIHLGKTLSDAYAVVLGLAMFFLGPILILIYGDEKDNYKYVKINQDLKKWE